jgi:PIN domain nuclease of toxin-antitoxin system
VTEPLLLDSHVWYWFVEGKRDRMARSIPRKIERAVSEGRAFVSAMSAWELGMLVSKRRLVLATDLADWIDATREPPGVQIADVTADIALDGSRVAADFRGDPADWLIVATARSLGASLVTCDERILAYAEEGNLRIVDGRA